MRSKIPAQVLIPVGYILTIIESITIISYFMYFANLEDFKGPIIIALVLFLIAGAIFMIFALLSLHSDDKSIALGVFVIIFCSAVGGIFYLIWQPQNEEDEVTNNSQTDEGSSEAYDNLKKLKELYDSGIIDKKTYEEKSKKYLDLL